MLGNDRLFNLTNRYRNRLYKFLLVHALISGIFLGFGLLIVLNDQLVNRKYYMIGLEIMVMFVLNFFNTLQLIEAARLWVSLRNIERALDITMRSSRFLAINCSAFVLVVIHCLFQCNHIYFFITGKTFIKFSITGYVCYCVASEVLIFLPSCLYILGMLRLRSDDSERSSSISSELSRISRPTEL